MKNSQRDLLRTLLDSADAEETRRVIERLLLGKKRSRDDFPLAERIADLLDERIACAANDQEKQGWLAWVETLATGNPVLGGWIRARALTSAGLHADASSAWDACIAALPSLAPEAFLHRAAIRLRSGSATGAAADLRFLLQQTYDYTIWTRASQLVKKSLVAPESLTLRGVKIAMISGRGATALLAPLLQTACFRENLNAKITEGDYDQLRQDVYAPDSWLYASQPDVIICHTHWRDAALPAFAEDPEARVNEVVETHAALWKEMRSRTTATIIAYTYDLPRHESYGRHGLQLPGGRGHMLREVNARLRKLAAECGVVLIDLEEVATTAGADAWTDARQWFMAKQHPATAGAVYLADQLAITLRAVLGQTKKVLVLDLDNVMWGGVIGEDGLEKIELGKTSPRGEAFAAFQSFARDLKERGVLLAVCSKNNDADARLPFESHPDSVLKLADFAAFFANWDDKVTNIRRIAETLSLGTDSFVFCDDNPVERAWVRSQLPEVAVPELPLEPAEYITALDRARWFESITFSEEDRRRHQQYQENAARESLRSTAHSLSEFLADLQMTATSGPIRPEDLSRVTQLVNKTNQFNLTTRRYTNSQLEAQASDERWWTSWFRLADRFGDHGLVGLITLRPAEYDPQNLEIDNLLMSCRVLGRTLEALVLRSAIEECRRRGVERLYGRYIPTAKNAQVAELLPNFGFEAVAGEEGLWSLNLAEATLPETAIELHKHSAR